MNLYPFAAAAERDGITFDELIEEIDIGGPALIRAAAKNHASVAVVTSPDRYDAVLGRARRRRAASRSASAPPSRSRPSAIPRPTTPGSRPSCRAGWTRPASSCRRSPACRGPRTRSRRVLVVPLEKVETLRYGENPHQSAARYRRTDRPARAADGPFATGAPPLQGKALSYNNVLDASAAAAIARLLRGPACVIVKHTNPCGAAERATLLEAWHAALAGDPEAAFGGVVALTGRSRPTSRRALTALFLEVVVAPGFEPDALEILATKPNLRARRGPGCVRTRGRARADRGRLPRLDPNGRRRGAGRRAGRPRRRSGRVGAR